MDVIYPGRFCQSPADATTGNDYPDRQVCGRPLWVQAVTAEGDPLLLVCPLHRDHGLYLAHPPAEDP